MNTKLERTASLRCSRAAALLVAMALGVVGLTQPAEARTCCCDITVESGIIDVISADTSVDCIEVEPGGRLRIYGGVTLTLTGPGPSCVGGVVELKAGGSTLAFTTNDHRVAGLGKIEGQNSTATISIASGVKFINDVKITGVLQIVGAGDFTNAGSVTADVAGTLDMKVTGTIDDEVGAEWNVKTSRSAKLLFQVAPACLQGDFTVSAGTLQAGDDVGGDDVDVVTSGDLTHTGGKIIAGVDDSFVFNGTCP